MSVTAPSRVDNTTPVLAQLVDAASKEFTGALEVSTTDSAGRDLQVIIWMEGGDVYAVHANGWNPPAAEYVRYRTGVDFSDRDDSPFKAAYETLRDGEPLMTADDIDTPRRDWAYGLLAASLTWAKPKIRRGRKATVKVNKMNLSPWKVVTADIAARVDGLESSWQVVCNALTHAGFTPVSAARACGVLAVRIEGSDLFTGAESLDQTAGRCGVSRYVILEELSRAILSGMVPIFSQAATPDVQLMVPEHWEDPARSWGGVEPVTTKVRVEAEVQPTPVEPEPVVELADPGPEPMVEQEVVEPEPVTVKPSTPAVPEPEPVEELAHVVDIGAGPASARDLIDGWLASSADTADAHVRGSIVSRLVESARTEAQARVNDLGVAHERLAQATADAHTCDLTVRTANEQLSQAQDAMARAETELARVQTEHADIVQGAKDATENAAAVHAKLTAEEETLAELNAQVAAQEVVVANARAAAQSASQMAEDARAAVEETAGPILETANGLAAKIRHEVLDPVLTFLADVNQARDDAEKVVIASRQALKVATTAEERARMVADTLDAERAA